MDIDKISELASLMDEKGLSRVRVEEADGTAFELERAVPQPPAQVVMPAAMPAGVPAAGPAPAPAAPEPVDEDEGDDDEPLDLAKATAVRAPMVGVFYAAPSPGAEPFVHVGSKVKAGETLCVIEAMKVMNEVTAEADGEVIDICANDGDLVEYGSILMKISEQGA